MSGSVSPFSQAVVQRGFDSDQQYHQRQQRRQTMETGPEWLINRPLSANAPPTYPQEHERAQYFSCEGDPRVLGQYQHSSGQYQYSSGQYQYSSAFEEVPERYSDNRRISSRNQVQNWVGEQSRVPRGVEQDYSHTYYPQQAQTQGHYYDQQYHRQYQPHNDYPYPQYSTPYSSHRYHPYSRTSSSNSYHQHHQHRQHQGTESTAPLSQSTGHIIPYPPLDPPTAHDRVTINSGTQIYPQTVTSSQPYQETYAYIGTRRGYQASCREPGCLPSMFNAGRLCDCILRKHPVRH